MKYLIDLLNNGNGILGTMFIQARSPAFVELVSHYGLDFIIFDMEHGPYTVETVADLIQVARLSGIIPIVRVGSTDYHSYSVLLDAGAQGIMTPNVEKVEQIQQINKFCRYPPKGARGFSRLTADKGFKEQDFSTFVEAANRSFVNIIQIESAYACEHLDELFSVSGIDAVVVGMDDLALSLECPGDTKNEQVEIMLEKIIDACTNYEIPWGLHIPDLERLEYWLEQGMQMAVYTSDVWIFQDMLNVGVRRLQRLLKK